MKTESWKAIWERKVANAAETAAWTLPELIAADGFDSAMGKAGIPTWQHIIDTIQKQLELQQGDSLVEVGCGAGAILFGLAHTGVQVCGTDYSAAHIAIARKAIPDGHFEVAQASQQPFASKLFDKVLSHGVFLYFPELDYADKTIDEMVRIGRSPHQILIMDIPDAAKQSITEEARRAAGASLSPPHLYYPKSFFEQAAARHGLHAHIFDQQIPGYGNAAFRFNALLRAPTPVTSQST